ncbi:MAG: hypothetical protein WBG57_10820 [Ornithinimicrobium sp.]
MTSPRAHLLRRTVAALGVAGCCVVSGCTNAATDAEPTVEEAASSTQEPDGAGQSQDAASESASATDESEDETSSERSVDIAADGTYLISGDQASFVMPSGNIQCVMRAGSVVCQISQKQFDPQQGDLSEAVLGDCSTNSADALTLLADDVTAWTCTSETIRGQASVDLGGWWASEGVGELEEVDGKDLAVLTYGQSMQLGSILCNSRQSGISCRDTASTSGFTLAREEYTVS